MDDPTSFRVIVILVAFVPIVWSLIALSLLSRWKLDVEVPADVIWLSLGIIGFRFLFSFFSQHTFKRGQT
jgi:hypothetical protein